MNTFVSVMDRIDRLSEWLERIISWMVPMMTFVIMWEVFARYLFRAPTTWAHEASTMLYGGYCILAGAYTQRFRAHVRSDAIYRFFPERVRLACDTITDLLAMGFLSILLFLTFQFVKTSWMAREFSNQSPWAPPLYPFKAMIPLATFLLLLQQAVTFLEDLFKFLGIRTERH
jgi:TRAP-type mannitol/chloroaromatic compound transport system permease small subunit